LNGITGVVDPLNDGVQSDVQPAREMVGYLVVALGERGVLHSRLVAGVGGFSGRWEKLEKRLRRNGLGAGRELGLEKGRGDVLNELVRIPDEKIVLPHTVDEALNGKLGLIQRGDQDTRPEAGFEVCHGRAVDLSRAT
jgi:hypothetical protein